MPPADPDPLLPLLDDAIASLGAKDRTVVIERYLRGRDLADVAASLGASPHAAQKRIERAVGKLQRYFAARGGAVTTAAVAAVLVVAAPTPAPASVVAAAAAAPTHTAAALARGVQIVLTATKLKVTAAVLLAACVAGGGAGLGIVWAVDPNLVAPPVARPVPPPAAPGGPVTATLSGGIAIELLGVNESPSTGHPWWRPDGSPLDRPPYDRTNVLLGDQSGRLFNEFAFRVDGGPASKGVRVFVPGVHDVQGTGAAVDAESRLIPGLSVFVAHRSDRPVTLRFEVAAGPWHTDLTSAGTGQVTAKSPGGYRVVNGVSAAGTGSEVDVLFIDAGIPSGGSRLSAVDAAYIEHVGRVVRSNNDGTTATHRVVRETFGFPDVPPESLRSLRLQSRPFDQWVEFRGVAVRSGAAAAVTVVTSDDGPAAGPPLVRPVAADETLFRVTNRYPRLAPFTDLRWDGPAARITVDGQPYTWVALDGRPVTDLVSDAKSLDADGWQKRLAEDLVEVLDRTGHPPSTTVALSVRPVGGGPTRTLENVPMTEENRRSVWRHRDARGDR